MNNCCWLPFPKAHFRRYQANLQKTLGCIVEAQGCYIEDALKKIVRHGVRAEVAAEYKHETILVDVAAMVSFNNMVEKMKNGGGVSFIFDLTNVDEDFEMSNDMLMSVSVIEDDNEDDGDDNNDNEYEADEGVGDDLA